MSEDKLYDLHGKVERLIGSVDSLKDTVKEHIEQSDTTNAKLAEGIQNVDKKVNSLRVTVAGISSGITLVVGFAIEAIKSRIHF